MNDVTSKSRHDTDPAFEELLEQITAQINAGELIDVETCVAAHPEYADRLHGVLPAMQMLVAFGSSQSDSRDGTASPTATPLGMLGDFRIIREIGRGGMGVVYESEQISLNRRVALKVLPFAAVLDPKQVQRFRNEAQAAASLDHPHIVPVYAVGCERGVHYYSMQYVEGQTLDRIRDQQPAESNEQESGSHGSEIGNEKSGAGLVDTAPLAALSTLRTTNPRERFRQFARLGIQAAEALHYAHEMGIVHRDIKPSNLLVDTQGRLSITDFGLASTQSDAGLTMTGDLLGTLRYMSPEQAAGDRAKIDYRTDIYSLGITLYELLGGRPAFPENDRQVLLQHIINDNPRRLRTLDPAIPRDLETIVLKATEKTPYVRYDSAAELAEDLQLFCDEKPIRARRTSRIERIWRWCKRNRLTAGLTFAVAALVTLVAITAPMIAWHQARLVDETRHQLYAKDVAIAYKSWDDGELAQVRGVLDRYAAGTPYAHLRDFPWHYLDGLHDRATAELLLGDVFDISFSTNILAIARSNQLIHLYNTENWSEIGSLPYEYRYILGFRFSPDGRFLAATDQGGTLSVWEVAAKKHLYTITADSSAIEAFSPNFSPDGSVLATGGQDHEVKIWDTRTGKSLRVLPGHRDDVSALAFSPDARTLATASFDYSLRLWDTETWRSRLVIENAHPGRIAAIAFDLRGRRLALTGKAEETSVWDTTGGKRLATLPFSGESLRFSPDSRLLAVAGGDRSRVHLWSIEDEELVGEYVTGHSVTAVAFLPSGELLFTSDNKLIRRAVRNREEPLPIEAHYPESEGATIEFAPAGDLMVAGFGQFEADPGEGVIGCWDLRRGTHQIFQGHDGSSVYDVAIDPTGELIAACGGPRYGPGFIKIWNARTGVLTTDLPKERSFAGGVSISPDGDRLAVVASGRIAVWHHIADQPQILWEEDVARAFRVAFSPQGDVVAVGSFVSFFGNDRPAVTIWDAVHGEQLDIASLDRGIMKLAFSPNGQLLTSIDHDGRVEVYDRHERRTVLSELAHHSMGISVAFSPDGRTLATASSNGTIKFWHVPTMMHVTTRKANGSVAELAFAPDGKSLAVGYQDRSVELWHVDREKERLSIESAAQQP